MYRSTNHSSNCIGDLVRLRIFVWPSSGYTNGSMLHRLKIFNISSLDIFVEFNTGELSQRQQLELLVLTPHSFSELTSGQQKLFLAIWRSSDHHWLMDLTHQHDACRAGRAPVTTTQPTIRALFISSINFADWSKAKKTCHPQIAPPTPTKTQRLLIQYLRSCLLCSSIAYAISIPNAAMRAPIKNKMTMAGAMCLPHFFDW